MCVRAHTQDKVHMDMDEGAHGGQNRELGALKLDFFSSCFFPGTKLVCSARAASPPHPLHHPFRPHLCHLQLSLHPCSGFSVGFLLLF